MEFDTEFQRLIIFQSAFPCSSVCRACPNERQSKAELPCLSQGKDQSSGWCWRHIPLLLTCASLWSHWSREIGKCQICFTKLHKGGIISLLHPCGKGMFNWLGQGYVLLEAGNQFWKSCFCLSHQPSCLSLVSQEPQVHVLFILQSLQEFIKFTRLKNICNAKIWSWLSWSVVPTLPARDGQKLFLSCCKAAHLMSGVVHWVHSRDGAGVFVKLFPCLFLTYSDRTELCQSVLHIPNFTKALDTEC